MEIVDFLKKLMAERGWSEYRLAKESSLHQSTIANIFHRNTLPSIPTLKILCGAFGMTLSEFFLKLEDAGSMNQEPELEQKIKKLDENQLRIISELVDELIKRKKSE